MMIWPVAGGLKRRPDYIKWLFGHHDNSNWEQVLELPHTDFQLHADHPLFHQFKPINPEYQDAVKYLTDLKKTGSMTPFEMSGKSAAGPISFKWSLDFIWHTGRVLKEAVHQYIARRVQKICEDLSKHKLKVNCNLYDDLEIWYNRSSRYVLKCNTTLVENEVIALEPGAVR